MKKIQNPEFFNINNVDQYIETKKNLKFPLNSK